jgi:exodeoxyribonuclease V gamma subunit
MSEDDQRLFGGVLPLDDVESGSIELAGRLAELIDRLRHALDALSTPKTIDMWAAEIADAADSLASTSQRDAWQRSELQRILDDVVTEATVAGTVHTTTLDLREVRALMAERLQGRPTRANFRTGNLTICTLVPMRSVPHRVVCLLGMDDGVFPRKAPRDGDDLILDDAHVGDRDPRTEDRQMLLDALLAATDRFIVAYTGNDERTNVPRPAAVPVGELLDVIDETVRAGGGPARERIMVRHPLQPFDPRNFTLGALGRAQPWSFDKVTLEGARALTGERREAGPFLEGPLPAAPAALLEVDDLVRFAQHPVRAFLRQRLGVRLGDYSDELDDALPVELDKLEEWGVGQRLLDSRLAGVEIGAAIAAEIARGGLPPGELARPVIAAVRPIVDDIAGHAQALFPESSEPGSVDVKVTLEGGRTLSGTVPGVCGDMLRTATYSRVNARHRLASWVRLLALTAAHPERPFEAVVLGRAISGAPDHARVTNARIGSLGRDPAERRAAALGHLATLVDLYDRGMREPLPLACRASAAYAQAVAAGKNAEAAATREWESTWNYPKEDVDLEHQLAFGGARTLAQLLEQPPDPEEAGDGWDAAQPTRFGRYACRLWEGLLSVETLEHR